MPVPERGAGRLADALDGPVPWLADGLAACGVIQLTGDLRTMARSVAQARHGVLPDEPFLVVGQQSVAEPTRAPAEGHTLGLGTHAPSRPVAGWFRYATPVARLYLCSASTHPGGASTACPDATAPRRVLGDARIGRLRARAPR